VRVRVCVCS